MSECNTCKIIKKFNLRGLCQSCYREKYDPVPKWKGKETFIYTPPKPPDIS